MRRAYNAPQLVRWGVLDSARITTIASNTTNYQGRLYSLYFQEDPFGTAPSKVIQLGTNLFLSFRSVYDRGVDRQVELGNAQITPKYTGVLLLHRLESTENPTLLDFVNVTFGVKRLLGGYDVWKKKKEEALSHFFSFVFAGQIGLV